LPRPAQVFTGRRRIARVEPFPPCRIPLTLLSGQIPTEVLVLPKLVDLVMWANNVAGEIPDKLCSNGKTLETLVISYNKIFV
jgi:hypothetical protein